MKGYLIVFAMLLSAGLQAQEIVQGKVYGESSEKKEPLPFASVSWLGTGQGTLTNEEGAFKLGRVPETTLLLVSYTGYASDTVETSGHTSVNIYLRQNSVLSEIEIHEEQKTTTISSLNTIKTELLGSGEFKKAACCNLSESFETNPTVEVSFQDALTGIRQIQMLGISGIYAQTLVENMPMVHGLNAATGMGFIPGPFVESVHLSKGAGSVAYGFQSMSGQINVVLVQPEEGDKLLLNGYLNQFGRAEANVLVNRKVGKNLYSGLMLHANRVRNQDDPNGDGFVNMPGGDGVQLINRWKYNGEKWEGQAGIRLMNDHRFSGQKGYVPGMLRSVSGLYGVEMMNRQAGAWAKFGRPSSEEQKRSIGFILEANRYENGFIAGMNEYTGSQNHFYGSFIFHQDLFNENHLLTGGLNLLADQYREKYNRWDFNRTEIIPGAFAEYTFKRGQWFSMVAGLRADYHNLFGFFATPRVHLRYAANAHHVFRASAGRGQRTANLFTENTAIFVSSRRLVLPDTGSGTYGLRPEVAWNYGANYTYTFELDKRRSGQLSIDYYHVYFTNQAVIDHDRSAREIYVSNLNGKSVSRSFQAQLTLEPLRRLEVRLAYRYLDVRTTYAPGLLQKALLSPHRGFINLGYKTKRKWSFDLTTQFIGKKRLPALSENPENLRMGAYSPAYTMMNAQISKEIKKWEIYVGGENLLGVRQDNLIVDAANPFGTYFDASMVWGPSMGPMAYVGFRYTVK
jgi:outer membrane receptor for ferrienterochelin and colicins